MTKKRNRGDIFAGIMQGAAEALAFANGSADVSQYRIHVPHTVDVRKIRKALNLTQHEFASRYGFGLARVRDWEQQRSHPDAALRAYLLVIAKKPEAVDEALQAEKVA